MAQSLSQNQADVIVRIGTEFKALRTLLNGNQANNLALVTTAKGNLVAAINELAGRPQGVAISDTGTSTGSVWSSQKVADQINTALAGITAGAPAALDTLSELATALGNDANFGATITTALANRVRYDAAQTLTAQQKLQARQNIDAASATDVGPTDVDFVAIFNASAGFAS